MPLHHIGYVSANDRDDKTSFKDVPSIAAGPAHRQLAGFARAQPHVHHVETAVGSWSDGQEPTHVIHFGQGATPASVRKSVSLLGLTPGDNGRVQKAVIAFSHDAAGPDLHHTIHAKTGDLPRLHHALQSEGIEYQTFLPKGDKTEIHVLDQGKKVHDAVRSAVSNHPDLFSHVDSLPGRVHYIGGDTREQGEHDMKQELERKGEHDEASRVHGAEKLAAKTSSRFVNHEALAHAREYHEKHKDELHLPPFSEKPSEAVPDPEKSRAAGKAFDELPHEPHAPHVKEAYDALKKETRAQYDHLVSKGVKFTRWEKPGQPYANSKEMREDVKNNKHLAYFPTVAGFGEGAEADKFADHPLYHDVPDMPGHKYNDLFRAVHDYFGHAVHGHEFGPKGEIRAWHEHARMFSPLARKALTTETHGQNSWVNFGPHHPEGTPPPERRYADQKAALLPEEHHPEKLAAKKQKPSGDEQAFLDAQWNQFQKHRQHQVSRERQGKPDVNEGAPPEKDHTARQAFADWLQDHDDPRHIIAAQHHDMLPGENLLPAGSHPEIPEAHKKHPLDMWTQPVLQGRREDGGVHYHDFSKDELHPFLLAPRYPGIGRESWHDVRKYPGVAWRHKKTSGGGAWRHKPLMFHAPVTVEQYHKIADSLPEEQRKKWKAVAAHHGWKDPAESAEKPEQPEKQAAKSHKDIRKDGNYWGFWNKIADNKEEAHFDQNNTQPFADWLREHGDARHVIAQHANSHDVTYGGGPVPSHVPGLAGHPDRPQSDTTPPGRGHIAAANLHGDGASSYSPVLSHQGPDNDSYVQLMKWHPPGSSVGHSVTHPVIHWKQSIPRTKDQRGKGRVAKIQAPVSVEHLHEFIDAMPAGKTRAEWRKAAEANGWHRAQEIPEKQAGKPQAVKTGTAAAVGQSGSAQHQKRIALAQKIFRELKLRAQVKPVTAHTGEGSRPSVAAYVNGAGPDHVEYAASVAGLYLQQPSQIVFTPGEGEDSLHVYHTNQPLKNVANVLKSSGLKAFVTEEHPGGTRIYVINPSVDPNNIGASINASRHSSLGGTATRIGSGPGASASTGAQQSAGRDGYRGVIDKHEKAAGLGGA